MRHTLLLGQHRPMSHQSADVYGLEFQPRVNLWNGLGTGKMSTGAWLAQLWWLRGVIDIVIVVAPSMCSPDWTATFTHLAWPEGLAEVYDARPPDQGVIEDILCSGVRVRPDRLTVIIASYGSLRSIVGERTGSRYMIDESCALLTNARGVRLCIIFDEAQAAALQSSQQSIASRALAASARTVVSMTATPIGNPLSMRLWGMGMLVRPDLLHAEAKGFIGFKTRYGSLVDPVQQRLERATGKPATFVAARAYPVSIHQHLIDAEVLAPLAPMSARRTKDECLDLPAKVYMRRSYRAPANVQRMLDDLVEEDRAVMDDGFAITVDNALEERLRTIELASGWLADRIVHPLKMKLLEEVVDEIDDNIGKLAPIIVWCSRTRELLACALVLAGTPAEEAMRIGTDAATGSEEQYRLCIRAAANGRVGVLHGRTAVRDRDRIQADWRAGQLRSVVAHPGVAGAGLNWQHAKATVYFSQPLGTIIRQQSEDRVHRLGLKHTALYYDLVMEDGPDLAVALAHSRQASAERAMLDWLDARARSLRA